MWRMGYRYNTKRFWYWPTKVLGVIYNGTRDDLELAHLRSRIVMI